MDLRRDIESNSQIKVKTAVLCVLIWRVKRTAVLLSCIRKKLAVEASAGYSFFFKFLLRKCGNIWNLCEVSPARLTEKCLYHYNGYDVDFMQNFTKPAVGEKKKHDKETKKISGADAGGGPFGRLCGSHRNDDIRAVFRIRGDRLGDSKCHDSECAEYTGDDGIYRKKTCLRSCCDSGFRDNGIRREDLV
mgnify:CR=1 FL=1